MNAFVNKLKTSKEGICYFTIPKPIMDKMKIKPFMTAHMIAKKDKIIINEFSKTKNVTIDLDKKTIKLLKEIMKLEGYGSLDEAFCNIANSWFNKKSNEQIVFIYPEDYFEGNYSLINNYKKAHSKGLK